MSSYFEALFDSNVNMSYMWLCILCASAKGCVVAQLSEDLSTCTFHNP